MSLQNLRAIERIGQHRRRRSWFQDFESVVGISPFKAVIAIASGSVTSPSIVDANHPGIVRFLSSTTTNSGGQVITDTAAYTFGGGEVFEAMARVESLTLSTMRLGFHDASSVSDAVDGGYFEMPEGGLIVAKTANNSTRTTSGTSYQLVAATWYRFRIMVNAAATAILYEIEDTSGVKLFDVTLTTNIPTSRSFGASCIMTNSGTSAIDIGNLDYMAFDCARDLVR